MLFQRGAITHLTEKRHAGVSDEDIERHYFLDGSVNLLPVRDVQGQARGSLLCDDTHRLGEPSDELGFPAVDRRRATSQASVHPRSSIVQESVQDRRSEE